MREFKDSVTGEQEASKVDTRSELPPPQPTAPVAGTCCRAVEAAAPAPAAEPKQETEPVS